MIELETGKAIVAVESNGCDSCIFKPLKWEHLTKNICMAFRCEGDNRKDGKSVIFKIVDYSPSVDGMRHGSKTTDGR